MGILILLGVIGLIVWAVAADGRRGRTADVTRQLTQRNQSWLDFIAGYRRVAKTTKEQALIQRMLDDAAVQGLGRPSEQALLRAPVTEMDTQLAQVPSAVQKQPSYTSAPSVSERQKTSMQLDNASILLYFGAFLFVAAAGLFVTFGGADGVVRMLVVLLASVLLYSAGVWLYHTKPKLRQAGQAFAGIGIVLAPLVGSALYVYVLHRSYGVVIWMLTSLFCLVMYAHALLVFRTVLMGYVLIFTLLSLFESGIGLAHVPLYYYGWGLAAVGLILHILQYWKGWLPELDQAAYGGGALFLPVSIVVALAMLPTQGATQLGVSLLIAAVYYSLEILRRQGTEREINAVVAQLAASFGVMAIVYGVSKSLMAADYSLLATNTAQLVAASLFGNGGRLWHNFGSVLLVLACGVAALSVSYHAVLLIAVLAALCTGIALWLHQERADAYAVAGLSLAAVPYIAGQLILNEPLSAAWQTAAGFAAVVMLLVLYMAQPARLRALPGWLAAAAGTYLIGVAGVLVCSFFAPSVVTFVVALGLAATLLILLGYDRNGDWADAAGVILLVPVAHAWHAAEYGVLLASTFTALAALIALSLRFRREILRWLSTITWLFLPLALGLDAVGGQWSAVTYAWAYVLAMIGLIISRAVARGVIYLSNDVPMSSYTRSASLSYTYGYVTAGLIAVCVSLMTANSRLHTTLILGVLAVTVIVLTRTVEKRGDILAFLPVLAQAILLSAIHPASSHVASYEFAVLSSATALVSYLGFEALQNRLTHLGGVRAALQFSVAAAFMSPFSVLLGADANWLMAFGLLLSSLLLQYHIRYGRPQDRESAGGIAVAAVWWLLAFAHVHETQAYTHTVVALLGFYAYWRHTRGDQKGSDGYLWWMIGVATVPLTFEALSSGRAVYGWWLLLEQITIMLIGMSVQRRFVTRWGLYVAVGAVLYQLRTYGYAALGFLALFLIGLAIFQLQKYSDKK